MDEVTGLSMFELGSTILVARRAEERPVTPTFLHKHHMPNRASRRRQITPGTARILPFGPHRLWNHTNRYARNRKVIDSSLFSTHDIPTSHPHVCPTSFSQESDSRVVALCRSLSFSSKQKLFIFKTAAKIALAYNFCSSLSSSFLS